MNSNNPAVKILKLRIKEKMTKHKIAASFFQKCNLLSNIISITLGTVSGLVGAIINNASQSVYIFMIVVHWLVTTLTTINHVFKFSIRQQKHYDCYRQYSNLCDELDLVILDPENNNIAKVENDFSNINLQEPELPACFKCCCQNRAKISN